jgi:hypothetical protein
MKMEAACTPKAFVPGYKITLYQIAEYHDLYFFTSQIYCFQIKHLFQEPDIHGVSVKNYTQSILEEIERIKKQQDVSKLITVVIGKCRFVMFLNSLFRLFRNRVKLFITK